MKTPFILHKRAEADPVRGLLLLSEEPADLLALFARLGRDPVPDAFAVAGGFLVKLTEATNHAFPQTIRLRCLSPDLFLPADADLLPPLLDDEAAALVRDRGLIFLPGGRILSYQPDQPLAMCALLAVAGVQRGEWASLPEPAPRAERLHEILLDRPEESPDELLAVGGDDIGTEPPLPDDASLPSTVRGKASLSLGKAFLKMGETFGWKGLSKFGANLIQGALNQVPRLSESILGAQEAALRALLREFCEGDLEKALRRALPMGADGSRGNTVANNANLPTHNVRFSLQNILGSGRGGGVSVWFGGGDVQVQLAAEYRKAAQEATARGDYRRAAFIYGKLLRDFRLAADVLSRGGLHHDAAVLYLDKVGDTLAAARSFEAAGEFDRALQLYRQREEHLLAAALLRKTGEEEAAIEEFMLAADQIVRKQQNHLAAGELMHERAGRTDLALGYWHEGWAQRPLQGALACLMRLVPLHAGEEPPDAFLALLAEADAFFAPASHEIGAGQFYNELARLAERPQLAERRDDLRDRALVGLANKLRQRTAHENKPGPQAAALFGRTDLWAPAQVNDAEFAYKAALRPTHHTSSKSPGAPTRTFLGCARITAVCAAPETGHVFIGFESGTLICFDPHSKTTVQFPAELLPVKAVTTDAEGGLVVALRSRGTQRSTCCSYLRSEYGPYETGSQRDIVEAGDAWLPPITEFDRHQAISCWSRSQFLLFGTPQLVPMGEVGHGLVPALESACSCLLLPIWRRGLAEDGPVVLGIEFDRVSSWCVGHHAVGEAPLGWNIRPGEALGSQSFFTWSDADGWRCEVARINNDGGGIYWSRLQRVMDKWSLDKSAVAAGHSGYQAVTILRPDRLAAVREGRVVWLRHAGKWLVPWSTQDLSLPAAHACFFSPRTNELTVITKDNHAVCVPVPNG